LCLFTCVWKRISGSGLARTVSERQAQWSDKLLSAIEHDTIAKVREELEEETKESDLSDGVLTEPNLVEEHKFRTPLMAAVVRKDLPIFMTLLRRFDTHFSTPSEVSGDEGGYCAPEDLRVASLAGLVRRTARSSAWLSLHQLHARM